MGPNATSDSSAYTRTIQNALPNVVRDIRTNSNLTQRELAVESGLSEGFVLRAEQYLHTELSYALANVLRKYDSEGRTAIAICENYKKGRNTYLAFNAEFIQKNPYLRSRVRAAIAYAMDHLLSADQAALSDDDSGYSHPFRLFRSHLFTSFDLPVSQIKFATFTGIHPSVITDLEAYRGGLETPVEDALRHIIGLDDSEIDTLKMLCAQVI